MDEQYLFYLPNNSNFNFNKLSPSNRSIRNNNKTISFVDFGILKKK